ncbi:hypothetical protein [Rhizobium sp. RM]|uniref:hypothetical protein n=1 Tax=Rhizobium sp. RM TaxID=2748079 RepID=UPI00110F53AE|nr:hypothetical protein [Rhizobium sp. RM]NWJ25401.1 hypothetical protein [Rhizobium sp. RM]TMV17519.1 hypothetical protein BJG94_16215 [Rhizobium sp. Td3]
MGKPSYTEACPLRTLLLPLAKRFTSYEAMQIKLVEDTIEETLRSLPDLDFDGPIDRELFKIMHRIALQELGITKGNRPRTPDMARRFR